MMSFSAPTALPRGPLMLDVNGPALTDEERIRLRHPLVGGVILFARNYESPEQLSALTTDIRAQRDPALIITVDQEGGRVQRFREGFTRIPSMGVLGTLWDKDPAVALEAAQSVGWVLGSELAARGIDLSFTPVLDINYGTSRVVSDRALHQQPEGVSALAHALLKGLKQAGIWGVGKHFPGHGWAEADSHREFPVDSRRFEEIWAQDILPYRHNLLMLLGGVMPAHVIYPMVDERPASFSPFWQQKILREKVGFKGVIFSDDLTMEAASVVGGIVARVTAAHEAGCDMVLVCNRPDLVDAVLAQWQPTVSPESRSRIAQLQAPLSPPSQKMLETNPAYLAARSRVSAL